MAKLVTLYKSDGSKFEEKYLVATDWSLINDKPTNFVPTAHSHDERYYTEAEVNSLLNGKLGSNDNAVSASKLRTSRTILLNDGVNSTATSFNGESNISIPITSIKESYLSFGGKNLPGSYGPIDASMVPELGANRLAFTPAGAISIQYSRDGGNTWIDYGSANKTKIDLFSGVGTSLSIGKNTSSGVNYSNYQLRVTLNTASQVYTILNKFVVLCSTFGSSGSWITIDARLQSNYTSNVDTWTTFSDKTPIGGWPGYNVINTSGLVTFGNTSTSQYGQVRFTFGCTGYSASYAGLQIYKIFGFGGVGWITPSNMAKYGRLYTYDYNQNAFFPAGITANGQSVVLNNDQRLANARPASDVYAWAKAQNKPEYNFDEIKSTPTKLADYGITDAYTKTEVNTHLAGKLGTGGIAYDSARLNGISAVNYVLASTLYDYATKNYVTNSFTPISSYDNIINGTTQVGNTKKVAGKEVKYCTQSGFAGITPVANVHYIVYEN